MQLQTNKKSRYRVNFVYAKKADTTNKRTKLL